LRSFNNVANNNNRTLDLALSNLENVEVIRELLPLVSEDIHHPAIIIDIVNRKVKKEKQKSNTYYYNFRKANFLMLYQELQAIDWEFLQVYRNVNDLVSKFYDIVYEIFDRYVSPKISTASKYPCWFTKDIISKLKVKVCYHKQSRVNTMNSTPFYQEFARLRRKIKKCIRIAYKSFIINSENNINSNSSELWNFI